MSNGTSRHLIDRTVISVAGTAWPLQSNRLPHTSRPMAQRQVHRRSNALLPTTLALRRYQQGLADTRLRPMLVRKTGTTATRRPTSKHLRSRHLITHH